MSQDYESAALGLVLVDPALAPEVLGSLEPSMLTGQGLPTVLEAMQAILAERKPVDLITVSERLQVSEAVAPVGGWPKFLSGVMHYGGVPSSLRFYLAEIKRAHLGREIIKTAQRIASDPDAGERIEELQRLAVARSLEDGDRAFSFASDLGQFTDSLYQGREADKTIDTGLGALDGLLGGLKRGDLFTISGRPGGGKTALLTRLAVNFSELGLRVLVFSTEMQAAQFVARVLPGKSGVPAWKLRRGKLDDSEKKRLTDACGEMHGKLNLFVVDKPKPSLADVRAWVAKLKPDAIVLDYLQRFAKTKAENVTREVDRFMCDLKTVCVEARAVGFLGCQMNRIVDRSDGFPKLSDLRDGGAIESESDQVLLLHTEPSDSLSDIIKITGLLEKNRHGMTGLCIFELERELVNIRAAREAGPSDQRGPSRHKVPSHGLVRKDAMAGNGYQPEAL